MYFRVVNKHIGEREGSSLKKIKDALERYQQDYEVDFEIIRDQIKDLYDDNKREVTYIIEALKMDVQKLEIEVESFVQLSKYKNQSKEALLVSKSNIIGGIYFVKASLNEYLVTQRNFKRSCTNGTYSYNDASKRPCNIYLTVNKREECDVTFNEYSELMDQIVAMKDSNLTDGDITQLRDFSEQLINMNKYVVTCFGDYFDIISKSLEDLKLIDPGLYHPTVTDVIIHTATPGELRTIYAPLYQDQRLIEEIINSYTRGSYTKQKIVSLLSGNTMTEIIGKIER